MAKLWPLLALVLAGAVALFLVGRRTEKAPDDASEDRVAAEDSAGELIGVGPDERGGSRRSAATPATPPPEPAGSAESFRRFLGGVVKDAVDGSPIPGAVLTLFPHAEPCPRLELERAPAASAATDAEGRFVFEARESEIPPPHAMDLFARARGHVGTVVCGAAHDDRLEIRLERGLAMRCRVADPRSRPVVQASLTAKPGPETAAVPGHHAQGTTDERGDAVLDELLPGDVLVDVDHPWFMRQTTGPYDPARDTDVSFVLTPALRASFKIRSDDGRPIKNPTVFWRTDGDAPKEEIRLLTCHRLETKGDPGSEMECESVRIPCDARSVFVEVKADGYAPWRLEGERLPPDGGERTFDVVLAGDATLGSVRVTVEDERGQKVHLRNSGADVVAVMRLDGMPSTAAYVTETLEDLRLPALAAGSYRIALRGRDFAPLEVDATAVAGRETEVHAVARPPAKLRVRFVAPEAGVIVTFRVTQGGRPVAAVPENAATLGPTQDGREPVYSAGGAGLLLSGLGTGTYVVEVTSEEVAAPPTSVRLEEGETEEVEIDVQPR